MPNALITGASKGLGRALTSALLAEGWKVIIDGRDEQQVRRVAGDLGEAVVPVAGDVTDPAHRRGLVRAAAEADSLDLVVNNASSLGPSPLPPLDEVSIDSFRLVLETNVIAPLALYQGLAPLLGEGAVVMNISSDAAVEAYPGWGVYGSSKAALDQLSAVLAAERTDLRIYAVDPGDMRTDMHQAAFPHEDISDRPLPESVVPALLALLRTRPASGRVVASRIEVAV